MLQKARPDGHDCRDSPNNAPLACTAVLLLLTGRDRPGLRAGTLVLVLALTIVNLITFYLNQLYTVIDAIGQLFLLFMAQVYRWRFYASLPAAKSSEMVHFPSEY